MAWYEHLFQSIFRLLFMLLDLIAYTCVRVFNNLFDAISQIRLFSSTTGETTFITEVASRLYVLIGVYALFKVTFVLINMMINPSDGSKGEKSVGKLATRIFVMLALTILVPFIFEKAYELQDAVLSENVIGQIILPDVYDNIDERNDRGQQISNQIFSSFVTISTDALENPNQNISKTDEITDESSILNADAKDSCSNSLEALMKLYRSADTGLTTNTGVSTIFPVINDVYTRSETGKNEFCINYSYVLSTVAGVFAAFIFAVYCLDIGVRVAKLAFYELIAPIPIVSYIDGKKDGPFYKWAKSTGLAFADIFIRLIIINFVLLLIIEGLPELMNIPTLGEYDVVTQFFAQAAVILGLLMFAKQAPDLIKDMFGIKGDGSSDYGLSFRNKLAKAGPVGGAMNRGISAGGAAIAGLAGAGAGLAGGAIAGTVKGLAKGGKGEKGKAIKENLKNSLNNSKIRGKATAAESLARLQKKNYNDKGVYNRSVLGRNLASQTLKGRDAGFGGMLTSAQDSFTRQLAYATPEREKTPGLKAAKVNAINAGYKVQNAERSIEFERQRFMDEVKRRADSGHPFTPNEIRLQEEAFSINNDGNFKNKGAYESYCKSAEIDPETYSGDYQNDIMGADGIVRNFYQNIYDDAGNVIRSTTAAERLEIDKYAQSVANKVVEHEEKLMNSGKK